MGFSKSFENGPNTKQMLFWFKKQFQKCITHGFQCSLVDINFFARTVSYTFLEMVFKPEYSVHGIGCNY